MRLVARELGGSHEIKSHDLTALRDFPFHTAVWAQTPQTVPVPQLATVTFKSGEWLLTKCRSRQQQDQVTCLGFVMGATDAVTVATAFGGACGTFQQYPRRADVQ